jgi:eukaryotic-like serine/threonine-protein kinase
LALEPGSRFGRYEIESLIGEGAMGLVYRATDTTLGRTVAIKILQDAIATHDRGVMRFEREAEVLAKLNHPNIAQIYGLEHADDVRALVMESVDGPTLADRLVKGALPIAEALASRNRSPRRSPPRTSSASSIAI